MRLHPSSFVRTFCSLSERQKSHTNSLFDSTRGRSECSMTMDHNRALRLERYSKYSAKNPQSSSPALYYTCVVLAAMYSLLGAAPFFLDARFTLHTFDDPNFTDLGDNLIRVYFDEEIREWVTRQPTTIRTTSVLLPKSQLNA
jgi:hypothetical protein